MGVRTLILDEPLAGQDAAGSAMIMDALAGLHGRGFTVVMVTHNARIACDYARRLVVMKDGRVHLDGSPREVLPMTGELAEAGILPPPVSSLSLELRALMPAGGIALSPGELAGVLASGVRKGQGEAGGI